MIIDTISPTLQNLFVFYFEQFGKLFLIILPLILSLIFIYNTWDKKEETPYILIGWTRILFYWLAKVYIFISPITLFTLHPFFDFWTIAHFMIIFYGVAFVIGGIIITFNIFYWSPQVLFKFMGYNYTMKGSSKALNRIEKQWGINHGKY
jgi:hypothetical protein